MTARQGISSRGLGQRALALSVVVLAAVVGGIPLANGRSTQTTEYKGHFIGDKSRSSVTLRVVQKGGKPRYAVMEIRGLRLDCEDGSSMRVGYDRVRIPFANRKTFFADSYRIDTSHIALLVIRGRVVSGGQGLKGHVTEMRNYDPTNPHGDCVTAGPEGWRAKRA